MSPALVAVRFNFEKLRRFNGRMDAAAARAVNRSAISVRAVAAREISKDMGLRVGTVREEIRIRRATATKREATLTVRGRRIPLIQFHARGPEPSRGRGGGVRYRLRGQTQRLSHAFIATMRSGHRGVFRRVGHNRKPIIELFGPSIVRVFTRRAIVRAMRARYAEVMPENLRREIAFALQRL